MPSQAALVLRRNLTRGVWKHQLPGERVLSERLGVSRPTLRAALALLRKEGWLEVARGRPTRILKPAIAKPIRHSHVALLTPIPVREMPPFALCWLDELRDRLAAGGLSLQVHVLPTCYGARPAQILEEITRSSPAAAWVLFRSTGPMQRWFQERSLPCLVVGSCQPDVRLPSVDMDYRAMCRHAVGFLFTQKRHRIALLLPNIGSAGDAESEQGFHEAIAHRSGSEVTAIVLRHNETPAHIAAALDRVLRGSTRPDGIIVARSIHVLTVVTHLLRRGVRLPEHATIVSRDEDAFLESIVPPIARYVPSPRQFAHRVSKAALALAQEGTFSTKPVRLLAAFIAPGH